MHEGVRAAGAQGKQVGVGIFARASPGLGRGHRVLPEAAGDGRLSQEPSSLLDSLDRSLVGSPVHVPGRHLCVSQAAGKHGQHCAGWARVL